jgi:hypothetical protein
MARQRGLSCKDVLACLGVVSDVDSKHEDNIEDSLSWDKRDPESNEVSDSYSGISASDSDSEEKQDGDSREILGKDGYVWSQKPKVVRRTPMQNIVKEKPGKRNGCQADTPMKTFELFFDDTMITEIVTWTNRKNENVKTSYTSENGFLFNTSVTEIRALAGFLLFLCATKNAIESTASI